MRVDVSAGRGHDIEADGYVGSAGGSSATVSHPGGAVATRRTEFAITDDDPRCGLSPGSIEKWRGVEPSMRISSSGALPIESRSTWPVNTHWNHGAPSTLAM